MKVSVIVPVYNVEQYLDKCLNSLVNQTIKDIEIIIVNDGTKDNSETIIKRYMKDNKNIKYYKKKNGGLSSARNYGLKHASGKYIAFVDSDDYVRSDMFEKMYNKCKKEKLDIVVCDTINVYEDGTTSYRHSNLNYCDEVVSKYLIAPPMAPIRFISSKLINHLTFREGTLYEDLDLMPSLALYTSKIGFIEEGLYYYLQRNNSIMNQKNDNPKLQDIFSVLENNYKLLYEKYPKEVEFLYIAHLLRSASIRFIKLDNYKEYLDKVLDVMNSKFPNWRKNIYYKQSSYKFKIICNLVSKRLFKILKLIV